MLGPCFIFPPCATLSAWHACYIFHFHCAEIIFSIILWYCILFTSETLVLKIILLWDAIFCCFKLIVIFIRLQLQNNNMVSAVKIIILGYRCYWPIFYGLCSVCISVCLCVKWQNYWVYYDIFVWFMSGFSEELWTKPSEFSINIFSSYVFTQTSVFTFQVETYSREKHQFINNFKTYLSF